MFILLDGCIVASAQKCIILSVIYLSLMGNSAYNKFRDSPIDNFLYQTKIQPRPATNGKGV